MRDGWGWWSRHVGAGALLVAGVRFSAFEWGAWRDSDVMVRETPLLQESQRPPPLNLDELKALEGSQLSELDFEAPRPELRRILIDWGQDRSRVYINGHYVGDTPYAGQVTCVVGDQLAVVLLPPQGAPSSRSVACRGSTMAVDAEPESAATALEERFRIQTVKGGSVEGEPQSSSSEARPAPTHEDALSSETYRSLQRALVEAQKNAERRAESFPE